ncbi:hypothetical protein BGZ63DRAFT_394954, partial [Mariannaea sp. PMI_226]
MRTTIVWLLSSLLAVHQCTADVTWRTIGCDSWSFQGQTINQIWDNAVAMSTQAQRQIDLIPTKMGLGGFKKPQQIAVANAKFIWGVEYKKVMGLTADGQNTMAKVKSMYGDILGGLQGTLENLDVNNAFLFCGSDGMVNGPIPDYHGGPSNYWHAELKKADNTIEYIALSYLEPNSPKPCTESPGSNYVGKTFSAFQVINGVQTEFIGMILCPDGWAKDGLTVYPALDIGYQATKTGSNKYPYIGSYNSISGTVIHEMTHVVGRVRDNKKYLDPAVGFILAVDLGKEDVNRALINPDSYRLFAEMSMSPDTEWGIPNQLESKGS